MMKKLLLFLFLFFLPVRQSFASNSDTVFTNFNYGIFGGISLNFHKVDFQKLSGLPPCETCPNYSDGDGSGPKLGAQFGFLFYKDYQISGRLALHTLNGDFEVAEPTYVMVEDGSMKGEFKRYLSAKLTTISFEPRIGYNIYEKLTLKTGFNLSLFAKSDYDEYEKISKPEIGATFADSLGNDSHSKIRNHFSGKINELNPLQFSWAIGASYELPLNRENSLTLNPEIEYSYGLTNIIKNYDWKVNTLFLGVSVKYFPPPSKDPIQILKKEEKIDTLKILKDFIAENKFIFGKVDIKNDTLTLKDTIINFERYSRTDTLYIAKKYALETSITACGVDSSGNEIPNPLFIVEEIYTTKFHPTFNYIFFDQNSSEIPKRFNLLSSEQAKKYSIDSLKGIATLPVYYDVLNILGKRLVDNSSIKLKINGYNNGIGEEKDNKQLSKNRAESIAEYLTSVWGIDKKRLKVSGHNLPEKVSTPIDELEKAQENQRVEISSFADELEEPTSSADIVRTVSPPVARFKPIVKSEAGIASGNIQIGQNGATLKEFAFGSDIKTYYDWKLDDDQTTTPKIEMPLEYKINVNDKKTQKLSSNLNTLAIEQKTIKKKRIEKIADFEIEKYSLILFDFDSDKINESNLRTLRMIKAKIKPNSKIKITGYTDRTGESEHNKTLSQRRAEAVYKMLGYESAVYEGVGAEKALFDNDYPEGRVFSRTVEISIESPVEYK